MMKAKIIKDDKYLYNKIKILGIVVIVLGTVFLSKGIMQILSYQTIVLKKSSLIWILSSVCYIISGIGILKLKSWAKNLLLILIYIWLFQAIRGFVPYFNIITGRFEHFLTIGIGLILYFLLYFIIPMVIIYFLGKKSIQELFAEREKRGNKNSYFEKSDYFGDYNKARSPLGALVVLLVRFFRYLKRKIMG